MTDICMLKGIVLEKITLISRKKWIKDIVLSLFPIARISFDDTSQGKWLSI